LWSWHGFVDFWKFYEMRVVFDLDADQKQRNNCEPNKVGKHERLPAVTMMYPARKCLQGIAEPVLMSILFVLDNDLTNPNFSR
jgi:hypothetical protein